LHYSTAVYRIEDGINSQTKMVSAPSNLNGVNPTAAPIDEPHHQPMTEYTTMGAGGQLNVSMMEIDEQDSLSDSSAMKDNIATSEDNDKSNTITLPTGTLETSVDTTETTIVDENVGWNKPPFPLFSYILPMANPRFRRSVRN
jgi:hypothetical protein